jgi:hypothetical protein
MFATVDLGDLVERIINGEFRQTNGKAISDWGKRFIGDGEEKIEFNGKNYADGSLFWDDFFKEMPKDEIKDFMTFCEDYLYLPNIEVDTVSNKWDFENGKVELKSNDKWGIGISDDYNIISVDEFTCDSVDAFVAYDVASSESDEDDYYESKKSTRKSLKESKIDYVFEDLANEYTDEYCNSHGGNFTKESIRQAFLDGCYDKKAPKGYHEFVAWQAGQRQIGKKSLKEGISAFNKAIAKKYNETEPNGAGQYYLDWRFDLHDEKDNIEAIADRCGVTVEFQSDEGYFEVFEESKKCVKKSLKESTDEDFSLYDLNKHDPFVKEWVKNINKELKDVSIESIGDDEIIFRVWFDETMDLDIFDDIVTDCMPKTLIEFMSDMNIDFGYRFVYKDDKFAENDYVFIRFVAW